MISKKVAKIVLRRGIVSISAVLINAVLAGSASTRADKQAPRLEQETVPATAAGGDGVLVTQLPVRYVRLGSAALSPGYFDESSGTFYRWRSVEIILGQKPTAALADTAILDASARALKIVEIEAPVRYAIIAEGKFAPAYFDQSARILYRWKGVSLTADAVPNTQAQHRNPVLDPESLQLSVVEIDPPVRYLPTQNGGFAPGYFDPSSKTFYKWKDTVLDKVDLGDAGKDAGVLVEPNEPSIKVIEINVPVRKQINGERSQNP